MRSASSACFRIARCSTRRCSFAKRDRFAHNASGKRRKQSDESGKYDALDLVRKDDEGNGDDGAEHQTGNRRKPWAGTERAHVRHRAMRGSLTAPSEADNPDGTALQQTDPPPRARNAAGPVGPTPPYRLWRQPVSPVDAFDSAMGAGGSPAPNLSHLTVDVAHVPATRR